MTSNLRSPKRTYLMSLCTCYLLIRTFTFAPVSMGNSWYFSGSCALLWDAPVFPWEIWVFVSLLGSFPWDIFLELPFYSSPSFLLSYIQYNAKAFLRIQWGEWNIYITLLWATFCSTTSTVITLLSHDQQLWMNFMASKLTILSYPPKLCCTFEVNSTGMAIK